VIGRVAAVAALVMALIAVSVIVLSNSTTYQVRAIFQNAGQIVTGDLVEVAGNQVGTVSNIALTPNGQAQLTLQITNGAFEPLRQGTTATVRAVSLSGIANRYVDLRLGPPNRPAITDDGVIPSTKTTSAVDLDQLFNTLNDPTRRGLQNVILGSASQYQGAGKLAQAAWAYLNPAVAASSTLFAQINRNTGQFTNYLVKTSRLVTTLAHRSTDLSGVVQHLSTTTGALAAERVPLGESLRALPSFMRLANTTFVNLRSALDDLTPLVNATKPVAPKLEKLLLQLRPLAQESVPTVRDLGRIVSRPGDNNDLTDLTRLGVPLAAATVRDVRAHGKLRPGAFRQTVTALNDSTPELAVARPYAVDLTGWFEGYTHPGTEDANGGSSRIAPVVGVGSIQNGALNILPPFADPALREPFAFGGGGQPGLLTTGQGDRCPGSMERGAIFFPESGFPCNPIQVPTGR
jgi:phospholipid/cholesterol/gamma-HCH transport system substrate-binding protein